ncbi:MAG: carbamoyltransferase C-terminal domain-containing protein [bacterium]
MKDKILGLWDGHDAGASIIEGDEIKVAFNEERLTRRKLEVGFPAQSIIACLKYAKISPQDIKIIAATTSDFSKTLTRLIPSLKERYYLIRRRKAIPPFLSFQKGLKYRLTELKPNRLTVALSKSHLISQLHKLGFQGFQFFLVDHHLAHAAKCLCSGFKKGLSISIDGVGDGLSASVNLFNKDRLERIGVIDACNSIGIFFEHVTNLLNMRELEDEGKVMALADFAYPIPGDENPMLDLFKVSGMNVEAKISTSRMYLILKKILWQTSTEQFARMAQDALEYFLVELFQNCLKETGEEYLCWSGGVASNIKANQNIRHLSGVKDWFVFPHMGDGGLAIGAALYINLQINKISTYRFNNFYLGEEYSNDEIEKSLREYNLSYKKEDDIYFKVANLLAEENVVFWFQGRMEIGPRALGNRSILARADSNICKNLLNLSIKKRVWYQPFCPSILEEDVQEYLSDLTHHPDKFMTMGYSIKKEKREKLTAISNIDGSCRPQILGNENPGFKALLEAYRRLTGEGIILNTSFNQHGEPIVSSPKDAIQTFLRTKASYMAIGDFLIHEKKA